MTVREANSGAHSYFSAKITFIVPHGSAAIRTHTVAVSDETESSLITRSMRSGNATSRIPDTMYEYLSFNISKSGILARLDPIIIMEIGTLIAPISSIGEARITGNRNGDTKIRMLPTDAIVIGFRRIDFRSNPAFPLSILIPYVYIKRL